MIQTPIQTVATPLAVSSCRVIDVDIQNGGDDYGYSSRRRSYGSIEVAPLPAGAVGLAPFVTKFFPANPIEKLGRAHALDLTQGHGYREFSLFFQAVHTCFAEHYPLALRPEVLMYLVINEIATAVNQNPDLFRDIFTSSSEREKIEVIDNALVRGNPASDWSRTLNMFEGKLAEKVPPATMGALLLNFTTGTAESRAATLVAFMDAAQSYYEYHTGTMCGIPRIRLDGSADDWQKFCSSIEAASRIFGRTDLMKLYFQHLMPVVSTIADQAIGGKVDNEFWASIYKWRSESGGDRCQGWITSFLAYTREDGGKLMPKPKWLFDCKNDRGFGGIGSGSFPTHVSSAPFLWNYYGEKLPMTYIGGILGVENDSGFVSPRLSYGVLNGNSLPPPSGRPKSRSSR